MRLDDLDRRLVPRLAAGLRTALAGGRAAREAAAARSAAVVDGPLRRLDDRFAGSGPLALVREVPQLGLLVAAAVFAGGSGVALVRAGEPERTRRAVQQRIDQSAPVQLGAPPGTAIAAYVAANRQRSVQLARATPEVSYVALVSFRTYLTPERTRITLGDVDVTRVVERAKPGPGRPGGALVTVPVTNLTMDVRAFNRAYAERKAVEAREFSGLAASITGTSTDELQFKALYTSSARQARAEAQVYRGVSCACVIGALVRGTARDLALLPAVATVRTVQVGPRSVAPDAPLTPLVPEQTTVVAPVEAAKQ